MITIVLILAGLALLVSLFTAAALIEVYERLDRGPGGPGDRAVPVELQDAIGTSPSAYGLPSYLDDRSAVILFLSPSCPACDELARSLGDSIPDQLHVVVTATSTATAREWLEGLLLPIDRCTIDGENSVAQRLGLQGTPVAVVVDHGRLSHATGVPSAEWLSSFLQEVTA